MLLSHVEEQNKKQKNENHVFNDFKNGCSPSVGLSKLFLRKAR